MLWMGSQKSPLHNALLLTSGGELHFPPSTAATQATKHMLQRILHFSGRRMGDKVRVTVELPGD